MQRAQVLSPRRLRDLFSSEDPADHAQATAELRDYAATDSSGRAVALAISAAHRHANVQHLVDELLVQPGLTVERVSQWICAAARFPPGKADWSCLGHALCQQATKRVHILKAFEATCDVLSRNFKNDKRTAFETTLLLVWNAVFDHVHGRWLLSVLGVGGVPGSAHSTTFRQDLFKAKCRAVGQGVWNTDAFNAQVIIRLREWMSLSLAGHAFWAPYEILDLHPATGLPREAVSEGYPLCDRLQEGEWWAVPPPKTFCMWAERVMAEQSEGANARLARLLAAPSTCSGRTYSAAYLMLMAPYLASCPGACNVDNSHLTGELLGLLRVFVRVGVPLEGNWQGDTPPQGEAEAQPPDLPTLSQDASRTYAEVSADLPLWLQFGAVGQLAAHARWLLPGEHLFTTGTARSKLPVNPWINHLVLLNFLLREANVHVHPALLANVSADVAGGRKAATCRWLPLISWVRRRHCVLFVRQQKASFR